MNYKNVIKSLLHCNLLYGGNSDMWARIYMRMLWAYFKTQLYGVKQIAHMKAASPPNQRC
jgi:hypothetical protein